MKNLVDIINKYEDRNKSRLKSYKATNNRDLLTLYVETEEFINDLKNIKLCQYTSQYLFLSFGQFREIKTKKKLTQLLYSRC